MAKTTFVELVKNIAPELYNILQEDYRKKLDLKITVLDVSYKAMQAEIIGTSSSSIKAKYFYNLYTTFKEVLREVIPSNRRFSSIEDVPEDYFSKTNSPPILIEDKLTDHKFIIGRSFGSIRTLVTDKISKHPKLIRTRFGTKIQQTPILNASGIATGSVKRIQVSRAQIGHTASEEEGLDSPLEQKILAVLDFFKEDIVMAKKIEKQLADLYAVQASIEYSFKNTTPEVFNKYSKILGEGFISVTIHTDRQNANFARSEHKIFTNIQRLITSKFSLVDIVGSNTIKEDIEQGIISILKGTRVLSKHTPHKGNTNKQKITVKKPVVSTKILNIHLRTQTGQFISPISIKNLLNSKLAQQIQNNMGKGTAKAVLNYRTGRFANSAEVTAVTNRDGAVTAFYSYMKNPYATFAPGGAQSSPSSRDPNKLIQLSIRQLATGIMANRLKVVPV